MLGNGGTTGTQMFLGIGGSSLQQNNFSSNGGAQPVKAVQHENLMSASGFTGGNALGTKLTNLDGGPLLIKSNNMHNVA